MQVTIDSGVIAFAFAPTGDDHRTAGADGAVADVVNVDGGIVESYPGVGGIGLATPAIGGTFQFKVTPTTAKGYVAGGYYNLIARLTMDAGGDQIHVGGPFQVVSSVGDATAANQDKIIKLLQARV